MVCEACKKHPACIYAATDWMSAPYRLKLERGSDFEQYDFALINKLVDTVRLITKGQLYVHIGKY